MAEIQPKISLNFDRSESYVPTKSKMSDIPQRLPLRIWVGVFLEKVEFYDPLQELYKKK